MGPTESVYGDLLPVLVQCFAIILVGYLCGRLKVIASIEANGLKVFVTWFALPAIAFKSLATLNLSHVNWKFVAAIALAKGIVFVAAVLLTLALSGRSYANAGLYAIASCQSNDFALGYPLISDLYSKSHPTFPYYLYLVAPIQLILLNPIAFTLMEYGTRNQQLGQPLLRKLTSSLLGIVKNPVVFMPLVALLWNICTNAAPLPVACLKIVDALSGAFSASALFLLGLTMVGQLGSAEKYAALTPVLIIGAKILACPLLLRHLVHVLNVGSTEQETRDFGSFGFLYGMLPTAPSIFIFAAQYGLPTTAVSATVVVGTLLSAPFIFVSAAVAQLSRSKLEDFTSTIRTTVIYTGAVSAVCSLWVLFVLSPKIRRVTHGTTFCLVLSQLLLAVGGILWLMAPSDSVNILQSVVALSGTFASRIWTALLSVLLAILHWRSLCFVLRIRWLIIVGGFLVSVLITAALTVGLIYGPPRDGTMDPNFHYGDVQANVAAAVLTVTLVITIVGMIVQQRFRMQTHGYVALVSSDDDDQQPTVETPPDCTGNCETCNSCSGDEPGIPDVEDLLQEPHLRKHIRSTNATQRDFDTLEETLCGPRFDCSKEQTAECITVVQDYSHGLSAQDALVEEVSTDPHQTFRHVVFLMLLCVSMVVGLAVSLWRPLTDAPTGILLELEFIDILLNYGQGIFAFVTFGLEVRYVIGPLTAMLHAVLGTNRTLELESQVPASTRQTCRQFVQYHQERCVAEIVVDGAFRGSDLVDWLINVGLCQDRVQGERYGEQLLQGRLIRHAQSRRHFADGRYTYVFQDCPTHFDGAME